MNGAMEAPRQDCQLCLDGQEGLISEWVLKKSSSLSGREGGRVFQKNFLENSKIFCMAGTKMRGGAW